MLSEYITCKMSEAELCSIKSLICYNAREKIKICLPQVTDVVGYLRFVMTLGVSCVGRPARHVSVQLQKPEYFTIEELTVISVYINAL